MRTVDFVICSIFFCCYPAALRDGFLVSLVVTFAGLTVAIFYNTIMLVTLAVKGTPVAIWGNCMLVELSPKYGFFDSEVVWYWILFVGLNCFIGISWLKFRIGKLSMSSHYFLELLAQQHQPPPWFHPRIRMCQILTPNDASVPARNVIGAATVALAP